MASKRNPELPEEANEWGGLEGEPEQETLSQKKQLLKRVNALKSRETKALGVVDVDDIPTQLKDKIIALTGDKNFFRNNSITNHQLQRLIQTGSVLAGGLHRSAVMICNDGCMLKDRCPLHILGKAPYQLKQEDAECLVEHDIVSVYEQDYVEAYARREGRETTPDDIRSNRFVMDLIHELVETYIIENRINTKMAKEGMLMEQAIAINNEGDMATTPDVSPLFRVKMTIKRKREVLLKQLLLTPEMELKKKVADAVADPANRASGLTKRAQDIILAAKSRTDGSIDAEIVQPEPQV